MVNKLVALAMYVEPMISTINQKHICSNRDALRLRLIVVMKNILVIEFHKNYSKLYSLFSKKNYNTPIPKAVPTRLQLTCHVKT